MRQVRFDIVGGASCPTDCEEEGVGYYHSAEEQELLELRKGNRLLETK